MYTVSDLQITRKSSTAPASYRNSLHITPAGALADEIEANIGTYLSKWKNQVTTSTISPSF